MKISKRILSEAVRRVRQIIKEQEEANDNIDRVGASGYTYTYRGRGLSRGRGRGRGGCWTCGGFNHDYKTCREKKMKDGKKEGCYVCGEMTHIARNCRKGFGSMDRGRKINAITENSSDSSEESL